LPTSTATTVDDSETCGRAARRDTTHLRVSTTAEPGSTVAVS
jgi:hypothetical protein